jgi:cell division septation protein DedD
VHVCFEDKTAFMVFHNIFPAFVMILLLLASASAVGGQDNNRQELQAAVDPLLKEARELSAEGKLQDAAAAYTKWLAENAGHADFGLILIEAADSQLSVESALELLRVYTPRVQDPRQQELCRASQIDLLEMIGRTEQALGLLRSFPPTSRWLYRQAQLLYQEGLAEEAEKSLQQALKALLSDENDEVDTDDDLEARIRLLQARIYTVQDRRKEAENLFQLLSAKFADTAVGPAILLAYYEYLLAQGRSEAAGKQLDRLIEAFPDSPELALARTTGNEEKIDYAQIPSRLLPRDLTLPQEGAGSDQSGEGPGSTEEQKPAAEAAPEPEPVAQPRQPAAERQIPPGARAEQPPAQAEQPPGAQAEQPSTVQPEQPTVQQPPATAEPPKPTVLVQTGSFRDRENAQYMVRDLKASGFEAGIVEKQISATLYFRVVIGPLMTVDQAQAVLMKLKDASFEGVLLFPE